MFSKNKKPLVRIVEWIFKHSKYSGSHQGEKEKARRVKQMEKGTVKGGRHGL